MSCSALLCFGKTCTKALTLAVSAGIDLGHIYHAFVCLCHQHKIVSNIGVLCMCTGSILTYIANF